MHQLSRAVGGDCGNEYLHRYCSASYSRPIGPPTQDESAQKDAHHNDICHWWGVSHHAFRLFCCLTYLTLSFDSACAASCIRMYFIFALKETYDGTWETAFLIEVSAAELLVSFLCACLPTYGPLYRWVFKGSLDTSKSSSRHRFQSAVYRNDVSAGHGSVDIHGGSGTDHPRPGICVTKDIDMSTFSKKSTTWVRVHDDDETHLTAKGSRHPTSSDAQSFDTLPGR